MKHLILCLLTAAVGIALLLAGCDDNASSTKTGETGTDSGSNTNGDTPPKVDAGPTSTLTEAHSGWKDPNCWTCHPESTAAALATCEQGMNLLPGDCTQCHGTNGAIAVPESHGSNDLLYQDCVSCHLPLQSTHRDQADYFQWNDCVKCHLDENGNTPSYWGGSGDKDTSTELDSDTSIASPMTDCDGGKADPDTSLCWQDPPELLWWSVDDAVSYCNDLELGGHGDWRLPTIQELISLIRGCVSSQCGVGSSDCLDMECDDGSDCKQCRYLKNSGANGCYWDAALGDFCDDVYWSSSEVADNPLYAWSIYFATGLVSNRAREFTSFVRCVRIGT